MKKICTTKNHIKAEHKKDTFQKYKEQNQKNCTHMNIQHTHNSLTTQKIVAVYFKDVKLNEETFSSQDQKLVETTNLWQLFSDKKSPQRNSLLQRSLTQSNWRMEQQWTHQDF